MEIKDFKFDSIEEAIEDFKAGKPVIVADDEDRENEGDVIISAEKVTPEKINFHDYIINTASLQLLPPRLFDFLSRIADI